jgi:glycosyltransferase involved in cell wall biosynthesis
MRIAIDIRPVLSKRTGVGNYLYHLLLTLSRIDYANEYRLFSSSLKDRIPEELRRLPQRYQISDFRIPVRIMNALWQRFRFPPIELFTGRADIVYSPHPFIPPSAGPKRIVTVHDLYFLRHPEWSSGEVAKHFIPFVRKSLGKADAVVASSLSTKKDCMECCGIEEAKITVVHLGIDRSFFSSPSHSETNRAKKKYGIPGEFILSVGTMEPRKNHVRLLHAFQGVHERHPGLALVIAGSQGPSTETILRTIDALGLRGSVILAGYVEERELKALYRAGLMLAFPSLYEGFGFPVLEAMACGTPVLASNRTSIPEIAGDAALLVDPEDTDEIREGMRKLVEEKDLAACCSTKGIARAEAFTWEKTAGSLLTLFRRVGS